MPERNYLKELWYNRPWRYIPAVIGHMQRWPWSTVKHKPGMTLSKWFKYILYINWQAAYRHSKRAVYGRCHKCLCFHCKDKRCAKKNCEMCDKLSKRLGNYGMTTTTCGRAHKGYTEEHA